MPNDLCAVLVPCLGTIDPDCESGLRELERQGYKVTRSFGCSAIDQARSIMACDALDAGMEEILWIDSDIGFDPNDVALLRNHNQPIVAGLYSMKGGGGVAARYLDAAEPRFDKEAGLFEIQYAGTGFLLTRRSVYYHMKLPQCRVFGKKVRPYFLPLIEQINGELVWLREDFAFCHRARLAGFRVMADTRIRLRHWGKKSFELGGDFRAGFSAIGQVDLTSVWKSERPGVLVLMATDSNGNTIRRAVASIEQSLKGRPWVMVILDNESQDGTVDQLRAMMGQTSAAGWDLKSRKLDGYADTLKALIDASGAYHAEFEAVLFADPAGQMTAARVDLIAGAIQRGAKLACGTYTDIGRLAKAYTPGKDTRYPLEATVIHSSILPDLAGEFPADSWRKLKNGHGISVQPIPSDLPALIRYGRKLRNPTVRQASIDRFFGNVDKVWDSITELQLPGDYNLNASIAEYRGKRLLLYRHDDVSQGDFGKIGWGEHREISLHLCELNGAGISGEPKKLQIPRVFDDGDPFQKCEDPRLFLHQDGLMISYNAVSQAWQKSVVVCANLNFHEGHGWKIGKQVMHRYGNNRFVDGRPPAWEKNWAYFDFNRQLHCVYCVNPHTVLSLRNDPFPFVSDPVGFLDKHYPFEDLRGGTPPIRVGGEFYSFFHTRFRMDPKIFPFHVYVFGCYAFQAEPPFRVTRVSRRPIMFSDIDDASDGTAAVFPCGAIFDRGKWLVSYGHNDFATRIVAIDHKRLIESMEKHEYKNVLPDVATVS